MVVWPGGCPTGRGPCLADQATDGDDGVGEVEERVDDVLAAFVAALQPVEAVVPGVGPLDVPALPGLDRGLVALMGDFAGHATAGEFVAGLLRVVAGVQVDGDVIRQRADLVEFVQRGGQQRGVVPVRRGQHPAQRDAVALDQEGAFHALFAAVDRAAAGAFPAAGGLGDAPVDGDVLQDAGRRCGRRTPGRSSSGRAKIPALIHSSRRSRIVVAPQVQSAIDSYEQPNRRTWISFSKMIRSAIRGRWQPSGCEGS